MRFTLLSRSVHQTVPCDDLHAEVVLGRRRGRLGIRGRLPFFTRIQIFQTSLSPTYYSHGTQRDISTRRSDLPGTHIRCVVGGVEGLRGIVPDRGHLNTTHLIYFSGLILREVRVYVHLITI